MVFVFVVNIGAAFVISAVIVAQALTLSRKNAWFDPVDERKIHTGQVPRLGGIGFAAAFIIISLGITIIIPLTPLPLLPGSVPELSFLFPLAGMILIYTSGLRDDFKPMAPRYNLLTQIIAAALVLIPGYTFRSILYVDLGVLGDLNWLRYPLTFLWVVGLTNALNLLDGLDGLAGGVSALAAAFFALVFGLIAHNSAMALICCCLCASLAGFLVFNMPFPRARIFMGDGGSQFLGFTLALLPLMKTYGDPFGLPMLYAAALLSIPIFDTFAAIWRRLRDGRRIRDPDRLHIHHKLMGLGLNARGVVAVLCGLQIVLGVLVFQSLQVRGIHSLLFLGAAYTVSIGFFALIHCMNRRMIQRRASLSPAVPVQQAG